jgi:hypothetical protein
MKKRFNIGQNKADAADIFCRRTGIIDTRKDMSLLLRFNIIAAALFFITGGDICFAVCDSGRR